MRFTALAKSLGKSATDVVYGIAFDRPGIAGQMLTCASLAVPAKSVSARRRMAICLVGAWKFTRKIAISWTGRDHLPTPP